MEKNQSSKSTNLYSDYFEYKNSENYLRVVKREKKLLATFIVSNDNDEVLVLLPYKDFIKKYERLNDREQANFLFELDFELSVGAISKDYLVREWQKFDLRKFVDSQLNSINRIVDFETELNIYQEIKNKINSEIPTDEIKSYLLKFKYDILGNKNENELTEINGRIYKFICNQLNRLKEQLNKSNDQTVLHPEIFKYNGFLIFDKFVKDSKSWGYDCSYAYRMMHDDQDYKKRLIHDHIKPGMFMKWVNENYADKDSLEEIKAMHVVKTNNREKIFKSAENNILKQKK